jgi:hypothetical protein
MLIFTDNWKRVDELNSLLHFASTLLKIKPFFSQVTSYGGPQPQSTVEYSIADKNIASISSSGLIEALKLGDTKVVGKAIGYDPETGKNEVYSQVRECPL